MCLRNDGFRIAGESLQLSPMPPAADFDILLFDADNGCHAKVVRNYTDSQLVALFTNPDERHLVDAVDAGVSAILVGSEVTPRATLLGRAPGPRALGT